jgi:hypothetical protein
VNIRYCFNTIFACVGTAHPKEEWRHVCHWISNPQVPTSSWSPPNLPPPNI